MILRLLAPDLCLDEPRYLRRLLPFWRVAGAGCALLARTNRAASGSQIPGQPLYELCARGAGKFRFRRPSHILRTCYRFPPLIDGLQVGWWSRLLNGAHGELTRGGAAR